MKAALLSQTCSSRCRAEQGHFRRSKVSVAPVTALRVATSRSRTDCIPEQLRRNFHHNGWIVHSGHVKPSGVRPASSRVQTANHSQRSELTAAVDAQQLLQPSTPTDSSPSALFEAARTSVPLFQTLSGHDGEHRAQAHESVLIEHIPGFASAGSSVYQVGLALTPQISTARAAAQAWHAWAIKLSAASR